MESLKAHSCSGINNSTKVYHFLQAIRCTSLYPAVNVEGVQLEKYGRNFNVTMSSLGKIMTKKGNNVQSICNTKAENKPVKPKVMQFTWKIECKTYPITDWNSMYGE